jgi:hypothetical protein
VEYTDSVTGQRRVLVCEVKAPMITVGPALPACGFTLKAWQDNAEVGVCHGGFYEGSLILTERMGCFAGLFPYRLEDRETIEVKKSEDCTGISETEMVLLSREWKGYQLIVGQKGVESWQVSEWDNNGLKEKTWMGRRRVTGWSLLSGGRADMCSAALVALISGEHAGKTGWLLWGSDGGLNISGALGDIAGALFLPGIESFPKKISDPKSRRYIGVPPLSITGNLKKSGSNPGNIGVL